MPLSSMAARASRPMTRSGSPASDKPSVKMASRRSPPGPATKPTSLATPPSDPVLEPQLIPASVGTPRPMRRGFCCFRAGHASGRSTRRRPRRRQGSRRARAGRRRGAPVRRLPRCRRAPAHLPLQHGVNHAQVAHGGVHGDHPRAVDRDGGGGVVADGDRQGEEDRRRLGSARCVAPAGHRSPALCRHR